MGGNVEVVLSVGSYVCWVFQDGIGGSFFIVVMMFENVVGDCVDCGGYGQQVDVMDLVVGEFVVLVVFGEIEEF